MRKLLIGVALLVPAWAGAQDAAQVARLDQEVRQLQREVLTLTQLVTQLRARVEGARPATTPSIPITPSTPNNHTAPPPSVGEANQKWLSAAAWRGLRVGMSELDVIGALGPPAAARGVDPERVLLYALEIGPASFLAGSVTLRDHAVVAIVTPVLK